MTGSAALGLESVPSGDRWIAATLPRPQSKTTAAIVLASTLAHAAVMSLLLVGAPAKGEAPHEVTVELVAAPPKPDAPKREAPKPDVPKPTPEKENSKQAEKPAPPPQAPRTPETAKVAAPDKASAAPEASHKADAKSPRPMQEAKAPKPTAAKAEPPPAQAAATTERLDQLKRQLVNELLQQHAQADAAAVAERHVVRPEAAHAASPTPSGFTSNAKSLVPIALPGTGENEGEAVGFEDLVFSQLAKAKDLSRRRGLPGTAGVRFTVDDRGGLSNVELIRPSGDKALDEEATSIVRRAAPFPVPPQGAERTFAISVDFVPDD